MAGSVTYPWVMAQPAKLRNRIQLVLDRSWRALNGKSEPRAPKDAAVGALYRAVEQAHQEDPSRTLLDSYREIIGPPYGLNASSAAVLLGLLLAARNPQRAIEVSGQQTTPAQWIEQAFARRPGRHRFDEVALGAATLRFFDGDAQARWRAFLDDWEAEDRYDRQVKMARDATRRLQVDPLPPTLVLDCTRLKNDADQAARKLTEVRHRIDKWQDEMQRAQVQASVHHALKYGAKAARQESEMQQSDVASLERQSAEALLRALETPPCTLRPEEQAWQREASNCLTAHLDRLGIDDLVARIERLSRPMRQALFERLSQLMTP